MTELNLSKGLEALYTFDSADFDNQRNHVRDRSGNGRHAVASGGPTMGVASPVGEAAGMDGSDDYFDVGESLAGQEQTVMAVFRTTDASATQRVTNNMVSADQGHRAIIGSGNFDFAVADNSGGYVSVGSSIQSDIWYRYIGIWDGSNVRLALNGEWVGTAALSAHAESTVNFTVSGDVNQNQMLTGDVAMVGKWGRALTNAEVTALTRMTARQVARL